MSVKQHGHHIMNDYMLIAKDTEKEGYSNNLVDNPKSQLNPGQAI